MSLPLSPMLGLRGEAARRLGAEILPLDPETGYLCEIRRGEKHKVLLGGVSPLNDAVASRLAEDKFHTALILGRAGLRVPAGVRCLKPGRFPREDFPSHTGVAPAERFADERGLPLVVKPNRGSRGRDIAVVESTEEMLRAVRKVWENDYLALVQEVVAGIDVRLDFLDGTFLFGYLRRPLTLKGDGRSTLAQLLAAHDRRFAGEAFLRGLSGDPLWQERTRPRHLDLGSVLAEDDELDLASPIMNLNRLATAERLAELPGAWLECGRRIGEAMGLRHFGVDFKVERFADGPEEATVLEVNASPSLAQMAEMGYREEAVAAEMRVVEAILA